MLIDWFSSRFCHSLFFYYQWHLHDKLIKLTDNCFWLKKKLIHLLRFFFRGSFMPCCSSYHQTLLSVNPCLACAGLNSSRHPSYSAKTLRNSQSIPNSDSLWKEAKRRQPSGFPVRLSSWIKQSNRQYETCNTATSSAYCSLFWERAEQAIIIIQAASVSRRAWSDTLLSAGSVRLISQHLQRRGCIYLGAGDPRPPNTMQLLSSSFDSPSRQICTESSPLSHCP